MDSQKAQTLPSAAEPWPTTVKADQNSVSQRGFGVLGLGRRDLPFAHTSPHRGRGRPSRAKPRSGLHSRPWAAFTGCDFSCMCSGWSSRRHTLVHAGPAIFSRFSPSEPPTRNPEEPVKKSIVRSSSGYRGRVAAHRWGKRAPKAPLPGTLKNSATEGGLNFLRPRLLTVTYYLIALSGRSIPVKEFA